MLDFRVNTFLTVCDEMNFTRAADKLHISQPAVSQHIKALEKYYDVVLFQYIGKRIMLTEEGKLLRNALLNLRNSEVYLREQLDFMTNKKKNIRFGATLTVGEYMISDMLTGFLQSDPEAHISVTVSNTKTLLEQLDTGEIEFAILEGDFPKNTYSNMLYTTEDFIAICSADYPLDKEHFNLKELTDRRLLLRESGSGTRSILEQELMNHELAISDFDNVITIGNMKVIKDMVLAGCGITFLYRCAVSDELESGSIRQIDIDDCRIEHEISIVWKKGTFYEETLREIIMDML